MRKLLWVLVGIFLLATIPVAEAAERRLPSLPGYGATLNASPGAAAELKRLRQTAASQGQVRVIVGLRVPYAAEAKLSLREIVRQRVDIYYARRAVLRRLPTLAADTTRSFDRLPILAVDVTAADIDRLALEPAAFSLSEDRRNKLMLAESVPLIQGNAAWSAGYTGLGQTIAIIDSGVDGSHPFLFGKVVSEACYSIGRWCPGHSTSATTPGSGRPCPASDCDHGTHVAGIAAGLGPSFSGVAKNANLIAIQVMSPDGKESTAYDSDIIAGLARVLALKDSFKIAAVNMSLGSETVYGDTCDSANLPMTQAIEALAAAGIATVVASGNSYSSSGLSYPACISSAVSVGSVSDSAWGLCGGTAAGVDKVACYSNSAETLSLLAPGSLITSSVPDRKFAAKHGTSMAAPHVAGAWAVLKEKWPTAAVADILTALTVTGTPIADARNGVVTPRINVKAALDALPEDRFSLTYTDAGPAQGSVSFSPAGTVASCNASCVNRYYAGTRVTLTANPAAGASFFGWGGACSGTGSCVVTMSAARSVSAGFFTGRAQTLSYAKTGSGNGTVAFSAAGFNASCAASCSQRYWQDATVTLVAQAADGSVFTGWAGECVGQKTSCTVRLSSAKSVTAIFSSLSQITLSYFKTGSGSGTVTIGSTGTCTTDCTRGFNAGTYVLVSAQASTGSIFAGWSGACQGPKQTCYFRLSSSTSLTANFRPSTLASRR